MNLLPRLRVLLLLLAFGLGLAGQAVASPAMAISASATGRAEGFALAADTIASTDPMTMAPAGHCPGCPDRHDTSMAPACAVAMCAALAAIPAQGPIAIQVGHAVFALVSHGLGKGVSPDPNPHPPKSTLLS